MVVDAMLLREATSNEPSLVVLDGPIRSKLLLEEPFGPNDIGIGWTRNKVRGATLSMGIKLINQSMMPIWGVNGLIKGGAVLVLDDVDIVRSRKPIEGGGKGHGIIDVVQATHTGRHWAISFRGQTIGR